MPGCAESRCDDREANSLITRRVTVGDSSDSPRATTRMACSSSAGSLSLMRKHLEAEPYQCLVVGDHHADHGRSSPDGRRA